MLVRYTYCHPFGDHSRRAVNEDGSPVMTREGKQAWERKPNAPIRPARPYECNTWLQEEPEEGECAED